MELFRGPLRVFEARPRHAELVLEVTVDGGEVRSGGLFGVRRRLGRLPGHPKIFEERCQRPIHNPKYSRA